MSDQPDNQNERTVCDGPTTAEPVTASRPAWINAAAWSLLTDTFSDPGDTQRMAEQFAACIERHWRAAQ